MRLNNQHQDTWHKNKLISIQAGKGSQEGSGERARWNSDFCTVILRVKGRCTTSAQFPGEERAKPAFHNKHHNQTFSGYGKMNHSRLAKPW